MRRVRMMTFHIDPALQWGLALSILAILTAWMAIGRPIGQAQPVYAPSAGSTGADREQSRSVVDWQDIFRLGLPTLRMTETGSPGFTLRTLQGLFSAVTRVQITDPRTFLAAQIPVLTTVPESQPAVWTPPSRSPLELSPTPGFGLLPEGDLAPLPAEAVKPPEPKKPSILIYHSHNAEAYQESGKDYVYNDDSQTMIRVGQELVKELDRLGVAAVQDTTHHMDIKFNDAYMNSRKTLQAALKSTPDYKMVIDLHRDATARSVTTTMINNEPVARILIILGKNEALGHPNWRQNEAFAKALHAKIEQLYPGLSRGISYDEYSRFNQDLHPSSLLLEIGGNLNSMDEALCSVRYLAKVLAELSK